MYLRKSGINLRDEAYDEIINKDQPPDFAGEKLLILRPHLFNFSHRVLFSNSNYLLQGPETYHRSNRLHSPDFEFLEHKVLTFSCICTIAHAHILQLVLNILGEKPVMTLFARQSDHHDDDHREAISEACLLCMFCS